MNTVFKILLLLFIVATSALILDQTGMIDMGLGSQFKTLEKDDDDEPSEDEDDDEENKISIVDGYKAVEIDEEIIDAAGIQFDNLYSINVKPEFSAFAEVVDVADLVMLKREYNDFLADKTILENNLSNSNAILKRAQALHKVKSLSTRDLELHRAERDQKASELNALLSKIDSFKLVIRANWGEGIKDLLIDDNYRSIFEQVTSHEVSVVLLSLLKDQSLNPNWQDVFVSHKNQRESALLANYLDRANQISNPLYGESYYYLLNSDAVRIGMQLFAWVEQTGGTLGGLFIPDSAVVWYANQPWVYVKGKDNLFIRRPLNETKNISSGWLDQKKQFNNMQVVIQGSQTLLSEEFKWAIPDEDDD